MSLTVVNVVLNRSGTVLVQFSDRQSANFTANELIGLARYLRAPDLVTRVVEPQGITLCTKLQRATRLHPRTGPYQDDQDPLRA